MDLSVKELRMKTGLSQVRFSHLLGVSVSSLRRWETAEAHPSPMAMERLNEIANLDAGQLLSKCTETDKKTKKVPEETPPTTFSWKGVAYQAKWMPYVMNGPEDQRAFYNELRTMQERSNIEIEPHQYFRRLSMFKEVDHITTIQYAIEEPNDHSRAWSSDYGTHGFHRYVGRFPAPVIRGIINAFGATQEDTILDPFCGSGTTLVEARTMGIKVIGIEISPLSAMISRAKSRFPDEGVGTMLNINEMEQFYGGKWNAFLEDKNFSEISHDDIFQRKGNTIKPFSNAEKWFSKEALLGTSIIVEYILTKEGYLRDLLTVALSAKMRSIGNVDVDVVRAEYRKTPRQNVDVLKLVKRQLHKMTHGIGRVISACSDLLGTQRNISVIQDSVLSAQIPDNSISYIITSPPYGVESLSYLRTHLLSFRALEPILGVDPYDFGEGIIGSEYISDDTPQIDLFTVKDVSKTYVEFFAVLLNKENAPIESKRIMMMMKFFEDMYQVIKKLSLWLVLNGRVAFIVGNKKIGNAIIPTDKIITEIFIACGFKVDGAISHKLKSNNSNSQVPWQNRIIENEFILFFTKELV